MQSPQKPEEGIQTWELELEVVVSCHVDTELRASERVVVLFTAEPSLQSWKLLFFKEPKGCAYSFHLVDGAVLGSRYLLTLFYRQRHGSSKS